MATEALIATGNRLDRISGADGHLEQTVVETSDGRRVASVSVDAGGHAAYYTVGKQCEPTPEIWRVSLPGGLPERLISSAAGGVVSPDGRYLAYTAVHPSSRLQGCVDYDEVVVRDLTTSEEQEFSPSSSSFVDSPVAWSADGRDLIVARGGAHLTLRVTKRGLREIGVVDHVGNGYARLPTGEPVTALPTGASSTRVVTFSPKSGKPRRTLAELDAALYLVSVDPSGTSLLMQGPLAESTDGWDLSRVDLDAPQPVPLASHVQVATWLPS